MLSVSFAAGCDVGVPLGMLSGMMMMPPPGMNASLPPPPMGMPPPMLPSFGPPYSQIPLPPNMMPGVHVSKHLCITLLKWQLVY